MSMLERAALLEADCGVTAHPTSLSPTSASWINQVEGWFAELTRRQIQRGIHSSTAQLEADIRSFIDRHHDNPKPFRWTKSADDILAAVKRFCQKIEQTLCTQL